MSDCEPNETVALSKDFMMISNTNDPSDEPSDEPSDAPSEADMESSWSENGKVVDRSIVCFLAETGIIEKLI